MDLPSDSAPTLETLPSRWARAVQGESDAFLELAASYWYCVYAWWRRTGLAAEPAAAATVASFTRWAGSAPPGIGDSGGGLMRQWLPARLEELAAADWEAEGEPAIEIEREWAEEHYADEPEGEPGAVFDRRWTLTVLEFAMQSLRAEYAARGWEALFAEASPFVGFEGADEEHYAAAGERMGMTLGTMRRAIFDLRTHHRDLLRTIVADTVADPAEVDGEITALLCGYDPPAGTGERSAPLPTAIRTFKPDELLARAMNSVHMTGGGIGTQWNPPSDAEAARLFPQYEIRGLVGRGAMGAVYRARQVALDRDVAIKLLPVEVSVDQAFADRFVREARAMAKLSHPNIISVYNFGTTAEGHLFFVMEYIEGADLSQIICGEGFAPNQAVAIAGQVCLALAYAHGKGVIHRDIKPANVMVDTEGGVKVADFGLARLSDANVDQAGQTLTGTIMGTEEYMAPEQKRGMAVDHRADIFSMGVMLYEMICKEPPQGAFEPPSERVGCDARIDQIVLKAMNRAPEDRFQSATEMKGALDASLAPLPATRPPQQRPPTTSLAANRTPYTAPPPEKSPAGWIAALAVAALLATGAFYFLKDNNQPSTGAVAQVSKKETSAPLSTPVPESSPQPEPVNSSDPKTVGDTPAATSTDDGAMAAPVNAPVPEAEPPANPTANAALVAAPKSAMEKWLEGVDGPQQAAFQKQVTRPYETGMEELRKSYLAALDAGQVKASATGKLDQAIIWNDERKAFEETGQVEPDDDSTPAPLVPLRAAFRTKLAKLESERASRAKTLVASYDALLARNFVLLTERGRTEDALLLKNQREEIARMWLEKPVGKATVKPFATKDRPFVNTLGMKFVPVPIAGGPTGGQRVLFSVWETRLQDYEAFALETGLKWEKTKEPLLPASMITWDDAQAFCAWLTERERKAGKLAANEIYRLPTDHEWSCAVGLGEQEDATKTPAEKNGKIPDVSPWGSAWPPPAGAGNYAGKEVSLAQAAGKYLWMKATLASYQDDFLEKAPVGSFMVNRLGLYDLGGNVLEWCEDWFDNTQKARVLRGGAYDNATQESLLSAKRWATEPGARWPSAGFRVVLSAASAVGPTSLAAAAPWENLFARLQPAVVEQTGHGWRMEEGKLVSPDQRVATMPLPGNFSGTSYQLRVKLRRLSTTELFHIVLPVGDRMTGFELDGWGSTYTGLNAVNGQTGKDLAGVVEGRQVKDAEPHDLEVSVRLNGADVEIATALDSRPLYTWAGPIASLTQNGAWATSPRGALAFGTLAAGWTVSEVKARRLAEAGANRLPAAKIDTLASLVESSIRTPENTELAVKVGALQLWLGQDADYAATCERMLKWTTSHKNAATAERTAKLISVRAVAEPQLRETARKLAQESVELGQKKPDLPWFQMALGMAEYRSNRYPKADEALMAAAQTASTLGKVASPRIESIAGFYRAMSLFKQDKQTEARELFTTTEAGMKPLPEDDQSLLASNVNHDDLISWLAYQEARALLNIPGSVPPPGSWADLLASLTPATVEQTGHGWRMKGSALVSPNTVTAMLPLPGAYSGTSYQVRLRVRKEKDIDTFIVSFPVGDHTAAFALDGWGGSITSFLAADGRGDLHVPGALAGRQVTDSKPHDLAISVHLNGANTTITTTLDHRPLFEWSGLIASLGGGGGYWPIPPDILALGTNNEGWTVSELKVKRLEEPRARAGAAVSPLPEPKIDATGWADLFAPLTPAAVEQTGHGWRMENGALFGPEKRAVLPLSGTFSGASYQLRVRLRQISPKDVFHVVLPVGDRMTGFELDGYKSKYTGLFFVNGKGGKDLPGVVEGKQVRDSKPHDLEVTVRLDGASAKITTTLDARPLYEWNGPIAALSQWSDWATTPPGSLALGTAAGDWTVSEVKVKRLGGK